MKNLILFFIGLSVLSCVKSSVQLISKESINRQKKFTINSKLSNGIPVIYRQIPDSDIVHVKVLFSNGSKDQPVGKKSALEWLTATMPMAAKGYPKTRMNKEISSLNTEIACSQSVEMSACDLDSINDFWERSLNMLSAVVKEPALDTKDSLLQKTRLEETTKQLAQNPPRYINEITNRVFYEPGHPFRLTNSEKLKELKKIKSSELKSLHKKMLNAKNMTIFVVGSMDNKKLVADLEKNFGSIKSTPLNEHLVPAPKFTKGKHFEFEHRDLPTAYIRAKVTAPGIKDKNAVAARLMFDILSKEMFQEIRSKRSLSYTPFAGSLFLSFGIGVMDVSTPKPKEAIQALNDVVNKLKTNDYSQTEIDEYKNLFATKYFLTQESHGALASAMANYYHFFKSVDPLYEMPQHLQKVTAKEIQTMAKAYLKDFRVGVMYDKDKFKKEWVSTLP